MSLQLSYMRLALMWMVSWVRSIRTHHYGVRLNAELELNLTAGGAGLWPAAGHLGDEPQDRPDHCIHCGACVHTGRRLLRER